MVYTVVQTHLSSKKFRKMGYLGNFLRNGDIKRLQPQQLFNATMVYHSTVVSSGPCFSKAIYVTGFSLVFFPVVQHHLDCLVHHLDHNGIQLCTTCVQGKSYTHVDGCGQICYSCVYKQRMHHRHREELCIVVVFVGWMHSIKLLLLWSHL